MMISKKKRKEKKRIEDDDQHEINYNHNIDFTTGTLHIW